MGNWNFLRIIRLVGGAYFIYGGIVKADYLSITLGGILFAQAVFNMGCCGVNACSTNTKYSQGADTKDIEFEEIK